MEDGTASPYYPEATGKNRTGRVTKSPVAALLEREPLGPAKSQVLAEEYPTATPERKRQILNALTVGNARLGVDLLGRKGRYDADEALSLLLFANEDALELYDPTQASYITYFAQWIKQKGIQERANSFDGFGTRRTANDQTNVRTIDRLRGTFRMLHGREPLPEEILQDAQEKELKIGELTTERIEAILCNRPRRATSFDQPIGSRRGKSDAGDSDATLYSFMSSSDPSPFVVATARALFPKLELIELRMHASLAAMLDVRYLHVLNQRWKGTATLQETGDEILLSRERVRQMEENLEKFIRVELGITRAEFNRIYETLQQCERILHLDHAPRWERPDSAANVRADDDEQVRPIQEIMMVVERQLASNATKKIVTSAHVPFPDLVTLQEIHARRIKAKIAPPRFTLQKVYQVLWETKAPSDYDASAEMVCENAVQILEIRLGLHALYASLALYELLARKLIARVPRPKLYGGPFQLIGPSLDLVDWNVPDPFDCEPPVFIEARPCRILYLLPEELQAWLALERCIETKAPARWSTTSACREDAWQYVLAALLKARILILDGEQLGYSEDRQDLRIEDIDVREPFYFSPERVDLIRAIQAQFRVTEEKKTLTAQLEDFILAWAKEHEQDPSPLLAPAWFSAKKPALKPSVLTGVVRRLPPDDVYAVSVEGLDAFQFIAESPEARKKRRRLAAKAALPAKENRPKRKAFATYNRRMSKATPCARPVPVVRAPLSPEERLPAQGAEGTFLEALTAFRHRLAHALARCDQELDLLSQVSG